MPTPDDELRKKLQQMKPQDLEAEIGKPPGFTDQEQQDAFKEAESDFREALSGDAAQPQMGQQPEIDVSERDPSNQSTKEILSDILEVLDRIEQSFPWNT